MSNYFEIKYLKRLAKVNYVLLTLFLAISVTSHLIAFRLTNLDTHTVIPSSFIYMADFVLIDVLAAFNPRSFTILVIFLEGFTNLFMLVVTNIVVYMPHPQFLIHAGAYKEVFSPIIVLYLANLVGTFIAFIIDFSIFYYFYKIKRFSFVLSSLISSVFIIIIYTIVTDFYAFRSFYPNHIHELIINNIVTNFISLLIYTILGRILLAKIFKYLDNK